MVRYVASHGDKDVIPFLMNMKNFLKFKTGSRDFRKFGEEYYLREAKLWRPFRLCGLAAITIALPLTLTAILNDTWIYGKGKPNSIIQL